MLPVFPTREDSQMNKLQKDIVTGLLAVAAAFGLIYGQLLAYMGIAQQLMAHN
jgi:hypothetical protein